jgi:glycosyltransferase involved in cell wall biosynthesis
MRVASPMTPTKRAATKPARLSIIIPCFNEENTLERCVAKVRAIADTSLSLEIIIVDDGSRDRSLQIARSLEKDHKDVVAIQQTHNQGKGAALRTGFQRATGDYVAVQDADLEYDPQDLKRLLVPLVNDEADVVFGSRFLSSGTHRVLYFWHSLGNRMLTLLSNMFTDLNLTDMETCYKVFRRDIIQSITIHENRFGFEPEIVAKVAQMRLRIFEMGVSYYGRTYEEGKKIGMKDGFRALYCVFRYNLHTAPVPIQFLTYLVIGTAAAIVNYVLFVLMYAGGWSVTMAAPIAFILASGVNYYLSVKLLFRHTARWNSAVEILMYCALVCLVALLDLGITQGMISVGTNAGISKLTATAAGLIANFAGRRFWVFAEPSSGPWKPESRPQV